MPSAISTSPVRRWSSADGLVKAAAAIQEATGSIDEATYTSTRLIRSAVEREFTIIGEALRVIAKWDDVFAEAASRGVAIEIDGDCQSAACVRRIIAQCHHGGEVTTRRHSERSDTLRVDPEYTHLHTS